MVLRKITVDNSVRFFPKNEQTKEIKQNTTKYGKQSEKIQPVSGGGKPNKKFSKKIKNLLKILQQEDSQYLNEE